MYTLMQHVSINSMIKNNYSFAYKVQKYKYVSVFKTFPEYK